jgi:hypothetical protein
MIKPKGPSIAPAAAPPYAFFLRSSILRLKYALLVSKSLSRGTPKLVSFPVSWLNDSELLFKFSIESSIFLIPIVITCFRIARCASRLVPASRFYIYIGTKFKVIPHHL